VLAVVLTFKLLLFQESPFKVREGPSLLRFRPRLEALKAKGKNLLRKDIQLALVEIMWLSNDGKHIDANFLTGNYDFHPRVDI
jgi:hypothetical protein